MAEPQCNGQACNQLQLDVTNRSATLATRRPAPRPAPKVIVCRRLGRVTLATKPLLCRQCTGDIKRHPKHMYLQSATNDADRNGVVQMFLRPKNVYAVTGVADTVATAMASQPICSYLKICIHVHVHNTFTCLFGFHIYTHQQVNRERLPPH